MVREESQNNNTKVFVRFLPMVTMNWNNIKILEDKKTIYLRCLQDFARGREHVKPSYWKFCTDGVFYNCTQNSVYNAVTSDNLINKILEGNNAIILSYGQTYSGKTVTTSGLHSGFEDRGIIPRIIEDVYGIKEKTKSTAKVHINMKYVETNRNYIIDLLTEDDELIDKNSLNRIRNIKVKSADDALKVVFKAETRKTVRSNRYDSNMANSVLTIIITVKCAGSSNAVIGKLHIVDLCGVDTMGNISCFHKNGFEIGTGNLEKTQMEQFLLILNEHNSLQIQNKSRLCIIVRYLKEALNSHSLLRFIGHIRVPAEDMRVTISMLRFGQLVRGLVPLKLHTQSAKNSAAQVQDLEDELVLLKKERDLNSMLNNVDLSTCLSKDRYEYIQKLAEDYLLDKNDELVLLSCTDAILAMKVFKNMHNKMEMERNNFAEQIKIQDGSSFKIRDSNTSRTSRRSSKNAMNSTVSLTRSRKGSQTKKKSSKDMASGLEPKEGGSLRSMMSSKNMKGKSAKRKSIETSTVNKSEPSKPSSPESQLPDNVPSHEEAWQMFKTDSDPNNQLLKQEFYTYEAQLLELNHYYTKEVKKLQDIVDIVNIRREEAYKAFLLRDLEDNVSKETETELEIKCEENLRNAEKELVTQKEVLLMHQTEMKLCIESRNKCKSEIDKKFEEFCKLKFHLVIPNLEVTNTDVELLISSSKAEKNSSSEVETQFTVLESCSDLDRFNKLRKYMKKEYAKKWRNIIRHQKWIRSCKLLVAQ